MGNFSSTSKIYSNSYGCKGEAIAALSALSKVEIVSKASDSQQCYAKRLYGEDRSVTQNSRQNSGTTIIVRDIFYNVPVRRKAMRAGIELNKMKDLIRKMAMLHFRVSFDLFDYGSKRMILNIPQDVSINARVVRLHSVPVLSSMTVKVHRTGELRTSDVWFL